MLSFSRIEFQFIGHHLPTIIIAIKRSKSLVTTISTMLTPSTLTFAFLRQYSQQRGPQRELMRFVDDVLHRIHRQFPSCTGAARGGSYREERRNGRGGGEDRGGGSFCIKCERAVFDFVATSRRIRKKNKVFFFFILK